MPEDKRTTLAAPILLPFPDYPFLFAKVLHILKVLDDRFMVRNAIYDMCMFEFLQSFTREGITFKTANDPLFPGAIAEPRLAVHAVRRRVIG